MTKSDGQKAVEFHLAEALTWAGAARPLDSVSRQQDKCRTERAKKALKP